MLVVFFFFFSPFSYLPLTPPLNLKALFSANWKSSSFSLPFRYIWRLWGRRKVHNPLASPLPLSIKIPYLPFSVFPFSPTPFLAKKSLFLSDHESILHRGNCPHLDPARSWFLLFSLFFCWCSFSWWGVGNRTAMGFLGTFNCLFFFFFHL